MRVAITHTASFAEEPASLWVQAEVINVPVPHIAQHLHGREVLDTSLLVKSERQDLCLKCRPIIIDATLVLAS